MRKCHQNIKRLSFMTKKFLCKSDDFHQSESAYKKAI